MRGKLRDGIFHRRNVRDLRYVFRVSAVNRGGVPLRLYSDSLKGAEITRLTFESCSSNDDRVTVVNEKADGDVVLGPYETVFAVKR